MILQRIDAGYESGSSAPEVWRATNEPPRLHVLYLQSFPYKAVAGLVGTGQFCTGPPPCTICITTITYLRKLQYTLRNLENVIHCSFIGHWALGTDWAARIGIETPVFTWRPLLLSLK